MRYFTKNKLTILFTLNLCFSIFSYSKVIVYEDADTNYSLKGTWYTDSGLNPNRIYNSYRGSGVVNIKKSALYKLKINDSLNNIIKWDIKMKSFTYMYVHLKVKTIKNNKSLFTTRTMLYYPRNSSIGLTDKGYIKIGIGNIVDDQWHILKRDIIKDLHEYDPNSTLIEIKEFWISGEAEIDNIETAQYRIFENGSGINNWYTFGDISNSDVSLKYDKYYKKNVISLNGTFLKSGYILKPFFDHEGYKTIQWRMKYKENFIIYIKVSTNKGIRYISYRNEDYNIKSEKNIEYFYVGLGKNIINNQWHTITRNLQQDLNLFEPNNEIQSIVNIAIRGSGDIDSISLLNSTLKKDDPIYGHKHYFIGNSGLSAELYSNTYDFYVTRLAERHNVEEEIEEAIILYRKRQDWKQWDNKVLVRSRKGVGLVNSDISKTPFHEHKIILKYNEKRVFGNNSYVLHRAKIINLHNTDRSYDITLKGIPQNFFFYGNTLFSPTNKILVSVYSHNETRIYRSLEAFDNDITEYQMEEIASFSQKDEVFLEPVMSYAFDKLIIAMRKDIEWFNGRDSNVYEKYINTKGELYFTNDLEGGDTDTIWEKRVLDVEIHGMYMPPYQNDYFLMIASNGENRQKMLTINSTDSSLYNLKYNENAFSIPHSRGGGYPSAIRNENEYLILYWEETSDLRKTNIVIRDLYDN